MIAEEPIFQAAEEVVVVPAVQTKTRTKEELLQSVSASRLSSWLGCRRKFYFRYLSGIRKPNTPARHVGTVVHAVLQQWNLARWRRAPLLGEGVREVFEYEWAGNQAEKEIAWENADEEAAVKDAAFGLLGCYFAATPIPPNEKPEAVEAMVEKDLSVFGLPKLIGVLDLVRSGARIVDFKTSGRTPNPEMTLHTHEVQLTSYAVLYREATDRREAALELHHLVKTKTPKLVVVESGPATDVQIERLFRLIESYVQGVQAEDFVPAPGMQCVACEFFNECRRWK